MPSRGAPTFYHWAQDKPCTTNQTYGFFVKDEIERKMILEQSQPKRPLGPNDYTRPFSNSAFFPALSRSGSCLTGGESGGDVERYKLQSKSKLSTVSLRAKTANPPPSGPKIINRGYEAGCRWIHKQQKKSTSGYKVSRSISAPAGGKGRDGSGHEIYLWHSLAGCLVHAENKKPARS